MPELGTRFLKLVLTDAGGKQLDRSVYWLPPKPDVLHFNETNYYQTNASFCNMTDLQGLPHAEPQLTPSATGAPGTKSVLVRNPSRHVLFSVHLRLLHANGSDVLPVLWSDNYFTLFAGESQLVTANYSLASGGQQLPLTFAASSWNQVMAKKAKTDDWLEDDPTKAALRPLDLRQFAVSPNMDSTISFICRGTCPSELKYTILDYAGRVHSRGLPVFVSQDRLRVGLSLPMGFFELELHGSGNVTSFGLISLPPHSAEFDSRWAIDTSMSWLCQTPCNGRSGYGGSCSWPCGNRSEVRGALVDLLVRLGIGIARERLAIADVKPSAASNWSWEGEARDPQDPTRWPLYDSLRAKYRSANVSILEGGPTQVPWDTSSPSLSPYPTNLTALVDVYRELARRWGDVWLALEVMNEPDIGGANYVPPDQLGPLLKAVRYAPPHVRLPV